MDEIRYKAEIEFLQFNLDAKQRIIYILLAAVFIEALIIFALLTTPEIEPDPHIKAFISSDVV